MSTNNSWNNQIAAANSAITLNSGINAIDISTDASATTVSIATGGAVKTVTLGSTNSTSVTTVACGTGGANFGTSANAHATVVGSTTALSTTTIQAPSAGVILTGVQGVAVANKNYVTINTATGAIGSDAGAASSISITGDTGGALTGASFTFTGGTTGLSFGGSGSTETLTFAGITANGGTVSLATDATTSTINVGTGAGVKTSTFGSTNSTSATTVHSGSGALNVTATNGALTVNSGTGVLSISSDASSTTVNIGTGGAAKTVTLGSTNGASVTAIKYGTADFTLASATGTVMSALDTGEITYPLQCAFLAYQSSNQTNKTGTGSGYTIIADTEVYDQNADYNNATGVFTAPVTGRYALVGSMRVSDLTAAMTTGIVTIATSNRTYSTFFINFAAARTVSTFANFVGCGGSFQADMDAADTATLGITIYGGAGATAGVAGDTSAETSFAGYLMC